MLNVFQSFLLRAGVGWQSGHVVEVAVGPGGITGRYTLQTKSRSSLKTSRNRGSSVAVLDSFS